MQKIKKNDEVIVLTGKSKGVRGKVLRVFPARAKVIVEGANLVKKHVKPDPNTNTEGGIMEREAALAISNVAIYNPTTQQADRVIIKVLQDGRKVRAFQSNGEVIDI